MDKKKRKNGDCNTVIYTNCRMSFLFFRYDKHLDDARICSIKKGLANGIAIGISFFVRFLVITLGIFIILFSSQYVS